MSIDSKYPAARAQLYVDDLATAISGTKDFRDEIVATAVLISTLLGFRLAFRNTHRGPNIIWIGAQIELQRDRVVVSVPEVKMKAFLALVETTLSSNVVSVRAVRTLAGKANHLASILHVWRPLSL